MVPVVFVWVALATAVAGAVIALRWGDGYIARQKAAAEAARTDENSRRRRASDYPGILK